MKLIKYNDFIMYINYYKFLQKTPIVGECELELLDESQLTKITAAQKNDNYDCFYKRLVSNNKED